MLLCMLCYGGGKVGLSSGEKYEKEEEYEKKRKRKKSWINVVAYNKELMGRARE